MLKYQKVNSIKDITIAPLNGKAIVSAAVLYGDDSDQTCIWVGGALQRVMFGRPVVVREQADYCFLKNEDEGRLCLYDRLGEKTSEIGPYYLFNKNCGQMLGGKPYLAATSSDSGIPILWQGGRTEEIDINGMLTGISVVVSKR